MAGDSTRDYREQNLCTATLKVLRELALPFPTAWMRCCNERYLHHAFSRSICQELNLDKYGRDQDGQVVLHPEWPTHKTVNGSRSSHCFAKYAKVSKGYVPVDITDPKAKGGWIDFAIGQYDSPAVGVEISYSTSWRRAAVSFDIMKLLDRRLRTLRCVASVNFLQRPHRPATGRRLQLFENRLCQSSQIAINHLRKGGWLVKPEERHVFVLVTEVTRDSLNCWQFNFAENHWSRLNQES